jgi:hypothetical protein
MRGQSDGYSKTYILIAFRRAGGPAYNGGEIIFFRKLAQVDASRYNQRCGLMDGWILD